MAESLSAKSDARVLTLGQCDWQKLRERAEVISRLVEMTHISNTLADEAGKSLGVSRSTIFRLAKRWRGGKGVLTDLAPLPNCRGRGKSRLSVVKNQIILEAITKFFLARQRPTVATLMKDIRQKCHTAGLQPPALNTVRSRLDLMDPVMVARRRYGDDRARPLTSAGGGTPSAKAPLDVVQIDHTVIDLMIVDSINRKCIGRPYLTVAIDEYSRSIVGFLVSLDPPSSVSVGLCLSQVATAKDRLLQRAGVDVTWPMHGIPRSLYLDNASEFKSEALRRGCDQHRIALHYRPPGKPHFGGIVERVIGTLMRRIHTLPGTTFSHPVERRNYDSEGRAALTLEELNKWLLLDICGVYHRSIHSALLEPPSERWSKGVKEHGTPRVVLDEESFLVDFLPVVHRRIGREGFVIDKIGYFSNALKPWIARRNDLDPFIVRRDPRDISRIWVLDTSSNSYLEVPYRTISNPSITLWEQRSAMRDLRDRGESDVDEAAIFRAVDSMRSIASSAALKSRQVRRQEERRSSLRVRNNPVEPSCATTATSDFHATPFDDIEEW